MSTEISGKHTIVLLVDLMHPLALVCQTATHNHFIISFKCLASLIMAHNKKLCYVSFILLYTVLFGHSHYGTSPSYFHSCLCLLSQITIPLLSVGNDKAEQIAYLPPAHAWCIQHTFFLHDHLQCLNAFIEWMCSLFNLILQ